MICIKKVLNVAGVALTLGILSASVNAAPIIGIGSMYDVLTPDNHSLTKRIYNNGDSTAFVRVELLEIDPRQNDETPIKEISGNVLEKGRLVVTPLRMIIPPNGFQSARIMWPGIRDKERYFRVRFTPVMPQAEDVFGLDSKAASKYRQEALQAGVNILTGYGTVVIVQPEKPSFNTKINNNATGGVTVTNNGNATVVLEDIRHCRSANTDCGQITREFLLPGRSHSVTGKTGFKTNFTLIEGNTKQAKSF
ncbi:hypothetical protein [Enterobacter bugandensis]|uniref:hypothetical protein n=1 Tax=Enterobacter bugandensis TaxID=881260 RepID=UPI0021D16A2A|nr:hypothetical protein [Enterobacter bugandensis]